jgi:hypothetical protein
MKKQITLSVLALVSLYAHAQNMGIGVTTPLGTLDVARGTAASGTALFRGTSHTSHFNYGTTEDTYIRGGKSGSHVIINDAANLGNVGIGISTPDTKLHVSSLSPEHLRLQGVTPYLSLYDGGTPTGYMQAYGNDLLIGTFYGNTIGALRFYNNNINNMTILPNGNIGIGNNNPAAKLHVQNNTEALRISGFNSFLSIYDNSSNSVGYFQNNSGNIDIGTFVSNTNGEVNLKTKGQQGVTVLSDGRVKVGELACVQNFAGYGLPRLSVFGGFGIRKFYGDQIGEWQIQYGVSNDLLVGFNGSEKAWVSDINGSWNESSDVGLKKDFEPYMAVLDGIVNLDVLTYHYKTDKTNTRCLGLVAQDVQRYFPELVSESSGPGSILGIAYGKTGVLAIKAIQEQQVIIEEQQLRIEHLEKRLVALEKGRR